jgi:anti-sigma factor RsiW
MSEINRDTMMAYLDDQLDSAARADVESHLSTHPETAAELSTMRRQADGIRTLYPAIGSEPLPPRLDPHRLALLAQRRRWQTMAQAAMVVALLGIGIATGWLLRPTADAPALYNRLIADAVSAHTVYVAENRHAVEVVGEETEHLSTWLSDRLSTRLAMPDLTGQGYAFLGGRLLPAPALPGGRAAQLMYEAANGERLTLYVTPAAGIDGPEFEIVRLGAETALYWADETISCTIVGDHPPEALEALATTVFAQLNPAEPRATYREL